MGVTYALGAQKSTLLRASYARFADQLGTGYVAYDNPVGYTYMTYPFTDANHNGLADPGELGPVYFYTGIDPNNPNSLASPNKIAPNLKNTKTDEFMVGVDHQILPELVAGVTYTHRHRSDFISTQVHRRRRRRTSCSTRAEAASTRTTSRATSSARPATTTTSSPRRDSTADSILTNDPGYHDRLQRRRAAVDEAALQPLDGARFGGLHRLEAERQRRQRLPRATPTTTWKGPTNVLTPGGASCGDGVSGVPAIRRVRARRATCS